MPDAHGYPLEEELDRIKKWNQFGYEGYTEFFKFLRTIWWAADWGFSDPEQETDCGETFDVYRISTGGWSGNEEIISTMRENFILWSQTWYLHRTGGHYTFRVRVKS